MALKLAYVGGFKVSRPRPVLTDYSAGTMDGREAHSRTVLAAVSIAVRRIGKKDFSSAAIYNEGGHLAVTIKRTRHGIMIHAQKRGAI